MGVVSYIVNNTTGLNHRALQELILDKREESMAADFLERVEKQASTVLSTLKHQEEEKKAAKKRRKEVEKILKKANISEELTEVILKNHGLFKYISHILTKNERIIADRKKVGLNTTEKVVNHLLLRNRKGTGCGCKLCEIRYKEYVNGLLLNSYRHEASNMDSVEEGLLGIKDGMGEYPLRNDPFASEFFNRKNSIFVKDNTFEVLAVRDKFDNRKIKRLKKSNNLAVLSKRVEKSKTHLHKQIQKYFGEHNKYYTICQKLPNKVYLPL